MDHSATKNNKLLKRRSSSVNILKKQKRPDDATSSSDTKQTNISVNKTIFPSVLPSRQNDSNRPRTTTIQVKPPVPQRNTTKVVPSMYIVSYFIQIISKKSF